MVEIIINKQILLSLFFSLYLKVKSYNNVLKKKWWKYLKKKIPLAKTRWKNYTIKPINRLDKLNTYLGFHKFLPSLKQTIEIDFKTLTIFVLNSNALAKSNNYNNLFNKLFSGLSSKFKYLNWKYIN